MRHWLRSCALCYAAGAVGGWAKGAVVWACARAALTAPLGEQLALALPSGLYVRLVWAGLYALLFVLPLARGSMLWRGLVWALVVSVLQLLVLPLIQHGSLHILAWSTVSFIVLNGVWGLVTSVVLHSIE